MPCKIASLLDAITTRICASWAAAISSSMPVCGIKSTSAAAINAPPSINPKTKPPRAPSPGVCRDSSGGTATSKHAERGQRVLALALDVDRPLDVEQLLDHAPRLGLVALAGHDQIADFEAIARHQIGLQDQAIDAIELAQHLWVDDQRLTLGQRAPQIRGECVAPEPRWRRQTTEQRGHRALHAARGQKADREAAERDDPGAIRVFLDRAAR